MPGGLNWWCNMSFRCFIICFLLSNLIGMYWDSLYKHLAFMFRLLVECLMDAGKKNDAADFSKVTSDFIEQHTPELYPRIFSIQVNHSFSPLVNCTLYYILPTQLSIPDCIGLSNMPIFLFSAYIFQCVSSPGVLQILELLFCANNSVWLVTGSPRSYRCHRHFNESKSKITCHL